MPSLGSNLLRRPVELCPSIHMRCRMTASLRATATLALRSPLRLASLTPQPSRRHPSAAPLYRCFLTGNDQARHRAAQNSRPVVRSLLRDAGSACRDWPTVLTAPSTGSPERR